MIPQILSLENTQQITELMREMNVDKEGINIMRPKAKMYVIKIKTLSNIGASIIKQQMLSLGGEAAICRDALTGKKKITDCLIFGTILQLYRLTEKLKIQEFRLPKLAEELKFVLDNYQRKVFLVKLPRFNLKLGERTHIMGIINLTPDSFSGDGLYKDQRQKTRGKRSLDTVVNYIEKMTEHGADIIDIGGESSRPGAKPVSVKEEIERTIPVIKRLVKRINTPISIDTSKAEVAERALDLGVSMVNDITALRRNEKMAKLISSYKAGLILMHMRGVPLTMQRSPEYSDLISEIIDYLDRAIKLALSFGIEREKIIIDPGIGFGKTTEHNLQILRRLKEFKVLGRPVLVGVSRKSFIGNVLNRSVEERLFGTLASIAISIANGADIVRVHDVKEVSDTVKISDAILKER